MNVFLLLSPSCFATCGHHLSPRIMTVFSLLSSAPNFFMPHSLTSLTSSPSTSHSSPYLSHSPTMCLLVSTALPRGHISVHLLPPPSGYYWYTSFFFLAGPRPLHKNAVVAVFSQNPSDRADTFSFVSPLLSPRVSLSVSLLSLFYQLCLSASLSLNSILSYSVLYPPNLSMGSIAFGIPPLSFHTFSTTLFHLITVYQLWLASSSLACSLLHVAI